MGHSRDAATNPTTAVRLRFWLCRGRLISWNWKQKRFGIELFRRTTQVAVKGKWTGQCKTLPRHWRLAAWHRAMVKRDCKLTQNMVFRKGRRGKELKIRTSCVQHNWNKDIKTSKLPMASTTGANTPLAPFEDWIIISLGIAALMVVTRVSYVALYRLNTLAEPDQTKQSTVSTETKWTRKNTKDNTMWSRIELSDGDVLSGGWRNL